MAFLFIKRTIFTFMKRLVGILLISGGASGKKEVMNALRRRIHENLLILSGRGDKDIDYFYEKYGCGEQFFADKSDVGHGTG